MRYLIAFSLLAVASLPCAGQDQVEVIRITSQPAASLIDAVRPLLGQTGSVSAFHDKLIVQGDADQIAAVRRLIGEIDRPARRLIIEVRQTGTLSQSGRRIDYGVHINNVYLGRVPPGANAQVNVQDFETRGRGDSLQRVQALDGRPALIRTGQSVPVYQAQQYIGRWGVAQGYQMQYRDTSSGFYALPRVHGNQVTVEIYQQNERPAANGRFDLQQASTVLRGEIGRWMTLGSIGGAGNDKQNDIGLYAQTRRAQDMQLELRVIPVN
jgi:hypothetical protein